MNATLEEVKGLINRHCPRISRVRLMVLIGIAAVFIWVMLGSKKAVQ